MKNGGMLMLVIGKAHRLNLSAKIKTRTATSSKNFDNSNDEKNGRLRKIRRSRVKGTGCW